PVFGLALLLILIYFYVVKSMNAFNYQQFDKKDFLLIQTELKKDYNLYLNSLKKDNSVQVTFNFYNILPPHGSTLELYSHKISNYIYIGPYQSSLSFIVKDDLFKNSLDSLTISLVDSENRASYTIEQEKVFNFWKKEKEVNIWFLPFRKIDEETGTTIGYTVSLD
ncbi:hypothetical protein, partial [Psychrobacter sp. AOP29-E1-7]|uniref:hypothetical protein n=1 Tax=Psychrobacter sp. AOP29-E1-7 TaxID=3457702 RepID=UPI00403692EC